MTHAGQFIGVCEGIGRDGRFLDRYTGRGEDMSPAFHFRHIPDGTQSFALVLRDESHPLFGSMTHWLSWNLPVGDRIEAGIPHGRRIGGICQGRAYGWHRYRGPKPPKGHTHRYVFTVYAVSGLLDLDPRADRRLLLKSLQGCTLASIEMEGLYQ
ncbi:YbhB/YbcL family Raf kinase inhibitor-like protein [Bifidobacterium xylocopae]|uniref:YbhB/YbcL family Raf kinase inhibitor-like protein n=1 Tax=Bifidobacterium xylocopae TaxID=2493119 RepID=A0A366KC09_9BIFI|nr:YbhB/YbcL family Raf kinase inhibitor-like protein [Bifidobacterium xylocopae]RBP99276.1 YbhB/YbcL family Raf kinase inhibitor-like protein [Bifidobacterium xylocopae]